MKDRKIPIKKYSLYFILDLEHCKNYNLYGIVKDIIEAGCRTVQLRGKGFDDKELFLIGKKVREITFDYEVELIINDRADLCVALGADGLHLGQQDLPPSVARRIIGEDKVIGLSTHDKRQLLVADKNDEVDYVSLGPVFKSPTKPQLDNIGPEILREVSSEIKKPLIAIGGITQDNIDKLFCRDLTGVAVASALLSGKNIISNTKNLLNKVEQL